MGTRKLARLVWLEEPRPRAGPGELGLGGKPANERAPALLPEDPRKIVFAYHMENDKEAGSNEHAARCHACKAYGRKKGVRGDPTAASTGGEGGGAKLPHGV